MEISKKIINGISATYFGSVYYYNKLTLRPYSEITNEHAMEIIELMSKADYGALEIDDIPEWLEEVFTGNCALSADYVNGRQMQILIDFLRSESYDCGYGPIQSLIDAGIAIKKVNE